MSSSSAAATGRKHAAYTYNSPVPTLSTPANLALREVPTPSLSASDVLIKVSSAALNPVDVQLANIPSWARSRFLLGPGSEFKVPGSDFSGTIVEVGSQVSNWSVGQEVFGLNFSVVSIYCRGLFLSKQKKKLRLKY